MDVDPRRQWQDAVQACPSLIPGPSTCAVSWFSSPSPAVVCANAMQPCFRSCVESGSQAALAVMVQPSGDGTAARLPPPAPNIAHVGGRSAGVLQVRHHRASVLLQTS